MSRGGRSRGTGGRAYLVDVRDVAEFDLTPGPRAAARVSSAPGRRAHRAPAQGRPPGATGAIPVVSGTATGPRTDPPTGPLTRPVGLRVGAHAASLDDPHDAADRPHDAADGPHDAADGPPTTVLTRPRTRAEAGTRARPVPAERRRRSARGPLLVALLVTAGLTAVGLRFLDPPQTYTLGVEPPRPSTGRSAAPPTAPTGIATTGAATTAPSAPGSTGAPGAPSASARTAPSPSAGSPRRAASATPGTTSTRGSAAPGGSAPAAPGTVPAVDGADVYVSPDGSDSGRGSASAPFRTMERALEALRPGDTLVVGDGTYREDLTSWKTARGSAGAPVTVRAAPGANPVVVGHLWFHDADHWNVSGIDVRWDDSERSGDHMVKFMGGTGFSFTDAEVSGARSYAAILLADGARAFRLSGLYVHDTVPTNGENQDHLIYVNTDAGGGVIERSVLAGSPNGRAIKVGPPSGTSDVRGNLTIRYNTMYDNRGPSNVQLSGNTRNVKVYRNIMVRPADGSANVTAMDLEGNGNVVSDNVYYDSAGIIESGFSGLDNGGGNVKADPRFRDAAGGDFRTRNAAVAAYGRYAS